MNKIIFDRPLCKYICNQFSFYHAKYQLSKRGCLLQRMITDKDKRKHWHFNIMNNKAKCRNVFEKIHRPTRRRNVLNSLFIKNITDVISTGEIVPEILYCGIEITGVKISPCCKILNVFWQVPANNYHASDNIEEALKIAAPKIRAELISRNVMGHVPYIYFLRDSTNARIADFEEALAKLDFPSDSDSCIIPDDSFVENIYSFKVPKVQKDDSPVPETKEKPSTTSPECPLDMKSDVFGLDRNKMMEKLLALRKKGKNIQESALVTQEMLEKGDLFSKIPGVCFEPDTTRETILKQFQIDRKIMMQKKTTSELRDDYELSDKEDSGDTEWDYYEEDYLEEEKTKEI